MKAKTRKQTKNEVAPLSSDTQTKPELDDSDVTAKHSFMKNPELKAMTFSYFQVKDAKTKRRDLFNAALTCKDFLEVALDALWEELGSLVPLLKLLPALQVENKEYVLIGNVSQEDWLRLEYYSRKIKSFIFHDIDNPKVHPSTYFRIAQLQSSALFPSLRHFRYDLIRSHTVASDSQIFLFVSPLLDSLELVNFKGFENTIVAPFLATLSSQMLNRIVLRSGLIAADVLENSIVHFEQLRSIELSDAVLMRDFALFEVLGALPILENLTLKATEPTSFPVYDNPENSNGGSGDPNLKYFDALVTLCVTGSFFLIEHLLNFIDSTWLKSIKVFPIMPRDRDELEEDPFTPSMTIIASKWSQFLEELVIGSSRVSSRTASSKCLMLLTDFHEMQTFNLIGWRMKNADDDMRSLVMSWPKLTALDFSRTPISLSTLRIIAENCPDLLSVQISLNVSIIPAFDASSKRLDHELEDLTLSKVSPQIALDRQIQVSRHLDLMFPYLISIKTGDSSCGNIPQLARLCQDVRQD